MIDQLVAFGASPLGQALAVLAVLSTIGGAVFAVVKLVHRLRLPRRRVPPISLSWSGHSFGGGWTELSQKLLIELHTDGPVEVKDIHPEYWHKNAPGRPIAGEQAQPLPVILSPGNPRIEERMRFDLSKISEKIRGAVKPDGLVSFHVTVHYTDSAGPGEQTIGPETVGQGAAVDPIHVQWEDKWPHHKGERFARDLEVHFEGADREQVTVTSVKVWTILKGGQNVTLGPQPPGEATERVDSSVPDAWPPKPLSTQRLIDRASVQFRLAGRANAIVLNGGAEAHMHAEVTYRSSSGATGTVPCLDVVRL